MCRYLCNQSKRNITAPLPLSLSSASPLLGSQVFAIGPFSEHEPVAQIALDLTRRAGEFVVLTGYLESVESKRLVVTSAVGGPLNIALGAPVVDTAGRLVGMIYAQNPTSLFPASLMQRKLQQWHIPLE